MPVPGLEESMSPEEQALLEEARAAQVSAQPTEEPIDFSGATPPETVPDNPERVRVVTPSTPRGSKPASRTADFAAVPQMPIEDAATLEEIPQSLAGPTRVDPNTGVLSFVDATGQEQTVTSKAQIVRLRERGLIDHGQATTMLGAFSAFRDRGGGPGGSGEIATNLERQMKGPLPPELEQQYAAAAAAAEKDEADTLAAARRLTELSRGEARDQLAILRDLHRQRSEMQKARAAFDKKAAQEAERRWNAVQKAHQYASSNEAIWGKGGEGVARQIGATIAIALGTIGTGLQQMAGIQQENMGEKVINSFIDRKLREAKGRAAGMERAYDHYLRSTGNEKAAMAALEEGLINEAESKIQLATLKNTDPRIQANADQALAAMDQRKQAARMVQLDNLRPQGRIVINTKERGLAGARKAAGAMMSQQRPSPAAPENPPPGEEAQTSDGGVPNLDDPEAAARFIGQPVDDALRSVGIDPKTVPASQRRRRTSKKPTTRAQRAQRAQVARRIASSNDISTEQALKSLELIQEGGAGVTEQDTTPFGLNSGGRRGAAVRAALRREEGGSLAITEFRTKIYPGYSDVLETGQRLANYLTSQGSRPLSAVNQARLKAFQSATLVALKEALDLGAVTKADLETVGGLMAETTGIAPGGGMATIRSVLESGNTTSEALASTRELLNIFTRKLRTRARVVGYEVNSNLSRILAARRARRGR